VWLFLNEQPFRFETKDSAYYFGCINRELFNLESVSEFMNQPSHNDAELVTRIRSGDQSAFDAVYKQHWLRLYRVACRITEDESIAQDIIQESFISFWEKGCHKQILNIESYLYQTVKFRCFMHLRAGTISKKHLDHFSRIAADMQAQDTYDLQELESVIEQGIASLPEKCRTVFYMSRMESLPNKQIAEKLHISPKTVENQITKALKHLRLSIDKMAVLVIAQLFS
jgi:RNA polymerase sigma-70 factor (family 1)